MYPRNSASPPRIAVGAVVQIADGVVQSSGVSVVVRAEGGSETAGGGTISYGASSSVVYYVPTQAETDYTAFVVTAYKTGCIPVSITVVTTESAVAGRVSVGMLAGVVQSLTDLKDFADDGYDPSTNKVQGVVLVDTLTTYTGNTPQTGDTYALANGASGFVATKADTAAILLDTGTDGVVVAAASKTGYSLTATTGLGNQTADITGNLSGSVGSVAGNVATLAGAATVVLTDASLTTAKLGTFELAKTTNITGFNDIAATSIVSAGAITTSAGKVSGVILTDTTSTVTDGAKSATALSTATWTGTLATNIGTTNSTVATNLNATITSRMATWTPPTGFLAATFPTTVGDATAANQSTLLDRLTSSRAGYLDNLNVGGAVASNADILALNQSASRRILLTTVGQYERPESGSTVYTVEARTFDGDGAATNADSNPTLTGTGQTTGSLAANIGTISNPATGVYRWAYTVASGATIEPIRFDISATMTSAFTLSVYAQVVDFVSATWTSTDASKLTSIYNKLPSSDYLTGTASSNGSGYATPTNVSDAQTAIITQVDANEAKIDTLTTNLATVDGIVNSILLDTAEIGSAGAGLTALAQSSIWTSTLATNIGTTNSTVATNLNATISSRSSHTAANVLSALGTGTWATAIPWNAAWDAEVQSEVQDAIEVNHLDHLLAVDYDPASKPGVSTALLNEIIGNDAGVSQFTANALELGPSGGGGGLDAAGVRAAVGLASANLDTQLADIPTVSEFNARTIPSNNYFDPATDTVANVTTVATTTNLTNLPAITTNWLTAAGLASDAVAEIQSGLATSASIAALNNLSAAQVNAEVDTAIADAPPTRITKNVALANFPFLMILASDDITPATGLTVTATRSIDGAAFAACANAVTEISNGWYKISLAASDLNGDTIALRFAAATANDRNITIVTQST